MDAACAVGGEHVKVESIAKPTQEELLNRRNAAIKASVAHLKEVENRDVLESQWDRWMAVRKMHSGTRLDGAQRRQLLKFFQIMDADGGGTIDAEELESPLLSTGMVANHRELQVLMDRINSSGQGEITFWEFIAAFKPQKAGAPPGQTADMDKLRLLLATVEHETLKAAFARDHDEDGLSDSEEPAITMYAQRAEGKVREAHRALGDAGAAERWFERLSKGGGETSITGSFTGVAPSRAQVAAKRKARIDKEREASLLRESHLSLMTRIGLHRRRFLLTSIMQENERHISKGADLIGALHLAETSGDHIASKVLHASLNALNQRHSKRIDRLAATAVVVEKEREVARRVAAGVSDDEGDSEGNSDSEGNDNEEEKITEPPKGIEYDSDGDPILTPLAIEIIRTDSRMPFLNELIKNCQRVILAAEASAVLNQAEEKKDENAHLSGDFNYNDSDLL